MTAGECDSGDMTVVTEVTEVVMRGGNGNGNSDDSVTVGQYPVVLLSQEFETTTKRAQKVKSNR